MKRQLRGGSDSAGFTLTEVLAVVLVMGILFATAGPNFRTFMANQQIKESTRALMSGAQEARSLAIARNGNIAVVFNGASWCIYNRLETATDTCDTSTATREEGELRKYIAPANSTINISRTPADTDQLTFDGLGRIVPNGNVTDPLQRIDVASNDVTRTYRVDFSEGTIRMCEPTLNNSDDPRSC